MKVVISGAGIAGLALAHCLYRKGHRPIVAEKAPSLRASGYMLGLVGAGYEAAERMDILDALNALQYTPERMVYLDAQGKEKFAVEHDALQRLTGPRQLNLMRGDIERVLYERVSGDIDLRFATTIRSIEQQEEGARVVLSDESVEECELVVGADGLHSRVRTLIFGEEEHFIHFLGCHAGAYVVDRFRLPEVAPNTTYTLTEPNRTASVVATGDDRLIIFFGYKAEHRHRSNSPEAELEDVFKGMNWRVPFMLDRLRDTSELYLDEVSQVQVPSWSSGRVVLLGDAGYAVSLIAGQGASMAMAGAYILAEELSTTPDDVAGALGRYEHQMQPKIARIQKVGRRNVSLFFPANRFQVALRDAGVRLASSVIAVPLASLTRKFFTPGGVLYETSR